MSNKFSDAADLIIENASVLALDKAGTRANAIAIRGNRIIALGDTTELRLLKARHTRMIDACGATVMPGIIESHLHIFGGAVELDVLNINDLHGFDRISNALLALAKKQPEARLLIAYGALHAAFGEEPITRQLLDRIIADRPLALYCFDHHTMWANTKALEVTGLLHGRALPPGNEVVMAADGMATGELREPAAFEPLVALTVTEGREMLGLTTGASPSPPATAAQRAVDKALIKRGLAYCASQGITSIQNMDGNDYQVGIFDELHKSGELICRTEIPFHHKSHFETVRLAEAADWQRRYKDDMLRAGRIKIFMDGVLESMTALMLQDYPGQAGGRGLPNFTAEHFNEVAIAADGLGLQISVHAIGDGAVRRTLDGYEAARRANGSRDSRHRIEHIELIDAADLPRLAELGVIASLQPIVGLGVPGVPQEPCRSRIAPDKLAYAYAWQKLRETGAAIAFSSDWPVSPLNPFLGMQAAMTAQPLAPGLDSQRQTLANTLSSYTRAGAYCEFHEDRKGSLKPGYLADVVMLDRNIETVNAEEIATVKPLLTLCDGRVTFEA